MNRRYAVNSPYPLNVLAATLTATCNVGCYMQNRVILAVACKTGYCMQCWVIQTATCNIGYHMQYRIMRIAALTQARTQSDFTDLQKSVMP